jgi:predicted RNA-binding protein with RPS1 domain
MKVRALSSAEIEAFVRDELLSPARDRPVVALTTRADADGTWLDPEALERELAGAAEVVVLETGDPTWELARLLPTRLDVYGGAVRVWWPGLRADSDPYHHRLFFVHSEAEAEAARTRVLSAVRAWAWHRTAERLAPGDVLSGRVESVKDIGAFVAVAPGIVGLVHKSEIDWSFVSDPGQFVRVGDVVQVQVLAIVPERKRIELSMKQALLQSTRKPPRPPPAAPASSPPGQSAKDRNGGRVAELEAQLERVTEEAHEAAAARVALAEEIRKLRAQLTEAKRELRSGKDALAAQERRAAAELDPLGSSRAFLLAVRLCHARMLDEDGRLENPLRRMRVGRHFLESARALEGLDLDKLIEVAAQVACGLAHGIAGRDVHPLRAGERGAGNRRRASDGASAWRCSLQDNTPSARRLHWWDVPGDDHGAIEFASVGLHDDFDIPE